MSNSSTLDQYLTDLPTALRDVAQVTRTNIRTFELAAAAEAAGYRVCLRCPPYRVADAFGDDVPELVRRAVQLIISGALDDANEAAVGARLGVSARHLRRMFNDHLGVTPDQFARSRRAHFARRLLDYSDLSIAEVAFAAGFGSLRQFNRAMREVFRSAPRELRERRQQDDRLTADQGLVCSGCRSRAPRAGMPPSTSSPSEPSPVPIRSNQARTAGPLRSTGRLGCSRSGPEVPGTS
jgi:methylphosphotriester-DNA--protein-cysteine methyltransferase